MAAPSWVDAVSVQALTKVAAGATQRATFKLTNYFEGYLFVRAARLSSSAPSAGIYIAVRRLLKGTPAGGSAGVPIVHPQPIQSIQDNTTASNLTTLNGAPTIPGASVTLTSGTGFGAGNLCAFVDSTTTPTVFETARASKISGTTLTFDENLQNTGIGNGATITNLALLLPPVWLRGTPNDGDIEVIFDNGAESTVAYAVEAWGQQLQSIA